MNRKYVATALIGSVVILGWNVFLVQRDDKLFKAYYQETAKEQYCKSLSPSGFHPDCNVK
jgi:hypothetical protein